MQIYLLNPIFFFIMNDQLNQSAASDMLITPHISNAALPALIRMLGKNFHSVVLRMAIQIERIAMILSALRVSCARDFDERVFTCSDTDFRSLMSH